MALDGDDAYFGEADYGFENNYDSYSYAGRGSGYSYGEGGLEEGAHLCKLCGKCYKTAGSLKNHRSLYHRAEIGKNRLPLAADGAMDRSMVVDDFDLDQI